MYTISPLSPTDDSPALHCTTRESGQLSESSSLHGTEDTTVHLAYPEHSENVKERYHSVAM
jgi:hypothetical protein